MSMCLSRRRRLPMLVCASALALFAAGCGDDDDDGGGNSASAPQLAGKVDCGESTGKRATGRPINVGAIVGATGPADFSSTSKGARAYFQCVNANGGIGGRPVKYIIQDDKWDPAAASQAARKLVQDDKVVAMIGGTSFVECGSNAGFYEKNNVLAVGLGVPRECFHSRNIAPTNQGPRLSGIGAAQYAKEKGAKSIACVANVIPNFGAWVCDGMKDWGQRAGVKVSTFLGKPDASDAQSITTRAINSDTDAVVLVDAAPSMVPYLKAAEQQRSGGEDKPWYLPTSAYELSFPKAIGDYWYGKLPVQIELSPLDSTGPDNTAWKGIMAKYGGSAPRDSFSQAGFLAAKIFTDTMRKAQPDQITRDEVTKRLRAVQDFKTDLLCRPWYFGDAKEHNPNRTGRLVMITGKGATGFENVKDCYDVEDPDLDPIIRAEGAS